MYGIFDQRLAIHDQSVSINGMITWYIAGNFVESTVVLNTIVYRGV